MLLDQKIIFISENRMYKSYRMRNTEQVATVGPQMVAGIRYRNEVAAATYFLIEVAAATSHNHAYRALLFYMLLQKRLLLATTRSSPYKVTLNLF